MYEAYGFKFPTHRAACRYRALVKLMLIAKVSIDARDRMARRFIERNGGHMKLVVIGWDGASNPIWRFYEDVRDGLPDHVCRRPTQAQIDIWKGRDK